MYLTNQVANLEAETIARVDGLLMFADREGQPLNPRLVAIAKTQMELGFAMLAKATRAVDSNKA